MERLELWRRLSPSQARKGLCSSCVHLRQFLSSSELIFCRAQQGLVHKHYVCKQYKEKNREKALP